MQIIPVIYHHDPDAWWADSPMVEGWTATASTLDELRALIEEGVRFALDDALDIVVEHTLDYGVSKQVAVVFDFVTGQPVTNADVWSSVARSADPQLAAV